MFVQLMLYLGSNCFVKVDQFTTLMVLYPLYRLYPLAGFNQRKLQQDVVLSGYNVPKGVRIEHVLFNPRVIY